MAEKVIYMTSEKTGNKLILGEIESANGRCRATVAADSVRTFIENEGYHWNEVTHTCNSGTIKFKEGPELNISQNNSTNYISRTVQFINKNYYGGRYAILMDVDQYKPSINRYIKYNAQIFKRVYEGQDRILQTSVTNTSGSDVTGLLHKNKWYKTDSSQYPYVNMRYWTNVPSFLDFVNTVPRDPTNYGPDSGGGGGNGNFNGTSDDIPIPQLPTLSAVESGFLTLYSPTQSQMFNLANYMWSKTFDIDTFKKLFADPMDVIIGVSIVPCAVPSDGARNVKIGFVDTGVSMNHVSTQYVEIDCGTVSVQNYFGSALDYAPYTRFSIFLPYIGTRTINTDDVMGKDVSVKYHIDLLSGTLTCFVACGGSVLYQYSGSCATQIPITSQNWGSALASAVALSAAGITAVATGGASLAATGAVAGASFAAGHVAGMKPDVQRSGAVSGAAGMLGIQTPYLIAELPIQSRAKDYNSFVGLPSNITAKLGDLSGYTEVETMHLEIAGATEGELAALDTILKGGVIL